ncbi:MAG: hypothetical protein V8T36_00360 [Ruthenibacterium lactatiformans]
MMVENAIYPYEPYAFLQKENLNAPLYPLLTALGPGAPRAPLAVWRWCGQAAKSARFSSLPEGEPPV